MINYTVFTVNELLYNLIQQGFERFSVVKWKITIVQQVKHPKASIPKPSIAVQCPFWVTFFWIPWEFPALKHQDWVRAPFHCGYNIPFQRTRWRLGWPVDYCGCISGWCFGTFFIFPYIDNNHPNWLIFSEGLKPPARYGLLGMIMGEYWDINGYLAGWWFLTPTPVKKMRVRQLRWWHP